MIRGLYAALLFLFLPFASFAQTPTVRIGVLGIFHSRQLVLSPEPDSPLLLTAGERRIFVRARSTCQAATVRLIAGSLVVRCGEEEFGTTQLLATDANQDSARFILTIPGKVARRYQGRLEIKPGPGELVPIVTMELETVVASVVQAETNPGSSIEALKAQAVVSRSYLIAAKGRHRNFDFCDLTHCQALRDPPLETSPAAEATAATRGLVLSFAGRVVATMFTRSCGGRTRTPQELGLPQVAYPYFSVPCAVCQTDPIRWTRKLSAQDIALLSEKGEAGRLAVCRRLGWNAVPSNNFTVRGTESEATIDGRGQGHGIGLCQRGAQAMAARSASFREILAHYFPKTKLMHITTLAGTAAESPM